MHERNQFDKESKPLSMTLKSFPDGRTPGKNQSIREVLKDVDTAQTIARHLTSREVGLKEIEQLKFVTSEDLSELSVIQARQLVAAWNQLYVQS